MRDELMLARAIEIAVAAHKGQTDKAGVPYILHPLRVMGKGDTVDERICGVLHDVIEDSEWTLHDLEEEGFSAKVIEALRCLTKTSEHEDYEGFISRCAADPLALKVKLNDLEDNLDVTRFTEIGDSDVRRLNKYLKAYRYLRMEAERTGLL